jgi:metal-sulfur cluster biosynthetic enzyme
MIPSKDEIVSILKSVSDPETEESVFDLGIVKNIDYQESTGRLIINVDFKRRNPSCVGCVPIAWMLQKKITEKLSEKFLEYPGVKSVEYIDN